MSMSNESTVIAPAALQLRSAAQRLNISTKSLRRLIKRGDIKANQKLRCFLVPISELDRWLMT